MEPIQNDNPKTSVSDGNPYFMGDFALIKFSGTEEGYDKGTYWLLDKNDHTIRPFESHMALDKAFGESLEEALNNTMIISPPETDSSGDIKSGILNNFTILGPEYAIKDNGNAKPLHFSNHTLQQRYGKQIDQKTENMATEILDGFLELLKNNEDKTNIPKKYIESLKNNERLMAFYISAIAYGDYTLDDIFLDIKHDFSN